METREILIGGKAFQVSSDDQYLAAMGNDFEPHMVQLFRSLIRKNDVVADIGANIGLTSLLFSELAQCVYAFEPSPSTFEILCNNLKINSIKNVKAFNIGLGQEAGELTITFAKNNRSGGFVSGKIRPEYGHLTEKIRIDTLDNFFGGDQPSPSFLKIDVEGFEKNVVEGGAKFLSRHQPTVVMEMNHFCLDVLQRITIPDFLDFMRSVFPVLYAVDVDNATIVDLHVPDDAYFVMHEHVVRQRFPNLVGGFLEDIKSKLESLSRQQSSNIALLTRLQNAVRGAMNKVVQGREFDTPSVLPTAGTVQVKLSCDYNAMQPSSIFEIAVTIKNQGKTIWYGYGKNPVFLSYHWLNEDGSTFIYDGLRTPLACESVIPGMESNELICVQAPPIKGKYYLIVTLVQEGICWLEDVGVIPAKLEVSVE